MKSWRKSLNSRLIKIAVFLLLSLSFSDCAHNLVKDKDIAPAPKTTTQKIKKIDQSLKKKMISNESTENVVQKLKKKKGRRGYLSTSGTPEETAKVDDSTKTKEKEPSKLKASKSNEKHWKPKYWPFGVGEKITYALRYGPIEGGLTTLEVKDIEMLEGQPAIHYHGTAISSKMLNLFYKVNNTVDVWVGLSDHMPLRQEVKVSESKRHGRRVVRFNQKTKKADYYEYVNRVKKGEKTYKRVIDLYKNPQDVVSSLYFYRFTPTLRSLNFPVYDRFGHWYNRFKFDGFETIRTPAGRFDAMRIKMRPKTTKSLKVWGDVTGWFSTDESKLLLKFKAKIKVGSITGELKEYRPGKKINAPLPLLKTPKNVVERTKVGSKKK